MTSRKRPSERELTGRRPFGCHLNRVARRPGAGIAASGHHRLMQAGFFRFLLAGNAAAAFWEDEPRRAVVVSETRHGGPCGHMP